LIWLDLTRPTPDSIYRSWNDFRYLNPRIVAWFGRIVGHRTGRNETGRDRDRDGTSRSGALSFSCVSSRLLPLCRRSPAPTSVKSAGCRVRWCELPNRINLGCGRSSELSSRGCRCRCRCGSSPTHINQLLDGDTIVTIIIPLPFVSLSSSLLDAYTTPPLCY
jgi:hypothetical protein